jgi:hypothetical protein
MTMTRLSHAKMYRHLCTVMATAYVPLLTMFLIMNHIIPSTLAETVRVKAKSDRSVKEYCSFFDNRAPIPQANLKNCTWFKENSCCKQEEIDATFGRVKALPGASENCQKYTNYLMCYICAPYQNLFYMQERLTVCEEFCNAWFEACRTAILKGSIVGQLYTNGNLFCRSRSFVVDLVANGKCFFVSDSLLSRSGGLGLRYSANLLVSTSCFVAVWMYNMVFVRAS